VYLINREREKCGRDSKWKKHQVHDKSEKEREKQRERERDKVERKKGGKITNVGIRIRERQRWMKQYK
jgi:hypothetical protein